MSSLLNQALHCMQIYTTTKWEFLNKSVSSSNSWCKMKHTLAARHLILRWTALIASLGWGGKNPGKWIHNVVFNLSWEQACCHPQFESSTNQGNSARSCSMHVLLMYYGLLSQMYQVVRIYGDMYHKHCNFGLKSFVCPIIFASILLSLQTRKFEVHWE